MLGPRAEKHLAYISADDEVCAHDASTLCQTCGGAFVSKEALTTHTTFTSHAARTVGGSHGEGAHSDSQTSLNVSSQLQGDSKNTDSKSDSPREEQFTSSKANSNDDGHCLNTHVRLKGHVKGTGDQGEIDERHDSAVPRTGIDKKRLQEYFASSNFEIVVVMEGLEPITTNDVAVRHCYSNDDVVFDHEFVDCVEVNQEGALEVDYGKFLQVVPSPVVE